MKRLKSLSLIALVTLTFFTFCSKDKSLAGRIIGTWKMSKVLELSENVTEQHNPDNNRWIRFMIDPEIENGGIFESGRDNKTENTGKWFINQVELFIDSDAGDDDDSYWQIVINENKMHWKGKRFDFNKRFEIFYDKMD